MRWAEITEVDLSSASAPLGCIAVRATFIPTILLATSVARDASFRAAVRAHAPSDNALITALKI